MKLTLTCSHGTWAVEITPDADGHTRVQYRSDLVEALMPRCPYCDIPWQPQMLIPEAER